MLRVHAGGREGLLPKPHKPCWLSQFGSIPSSLIKSLTCVWPHLGRIHLLAPKRVLTHCVISTFHDNARVTRARTTAECL